MAVNPVTNQIYVANIASHTVTVIDGATNGTTTLLAGSDSFSEAVNPVTNKVYVASLDGTVTVIDVDKSQAVPITVSASGVADAQTVTNSNLFATTNPNPAFTATATTAFASSSAYLGLSGLTNPIPTSLYYWVDDVASHGLDPVAPSSGTFSITPSGVSVGVHTLYLFAAYGAEGGTASSGVCSGNSPEISNRVAVPFLVLPIRTEAAVAASANPQNLASSVTFTATVTPDSMGSSSPTGTVSFFDGSTLLGSGSLVDLSGSCTASFATSSLTAGSHTINVIYSGDSLYGYSSGTSTEQIVTASTINAWPSASAITYGQTLAASTLSGGSSTPAGTFAWTTSATVPGTGTASYGVTFTPTDTTNYSTATSTVSVTVNKATATVTWPSASAITYGQTLAASTLSGGSSTPAGTFAWTTSATVPSTGTASYSVTFTPTETTNYSTATSTVSVTVNKATATVTWPSASAISYGQTLASATLSGGSSTPAGTFAWSTPTTVPALGTASYSVIFSPTDTVSYSIATGMVNVTVSDVLPIVYTVTYATDGTTGASLTGSASQSVNSGASAAAVTANAPIGYGFVNWTGTNGFVTTTSNPLTVASVGAAYVVTARFSADAVIITIPPAPTVTVSPGNGVATTALTLASQGNVSNPVTLTVTGLPTGATCTFSSSTVDLSNGPVTVKVTITTTPTPQIIGQNKGINPLGGIGASALFSCGILVLPSRRRRKRLGIFLSAMVVVLMGGPDGLPWKQLHQEPHQRLGWHPSRHLFNYRDSKCPGGRHGQHYLPTDRQLSQDPA